MGVWCEFHSAHYFIFPLRLCVCSDYVWTKTSLKHPVAYAWMFPRGGGGGGGEGGNIACIPCMIDDAPGLRLKKLMTGGGGGGGRTKTLFFSRRKKKIGQFSRFEVGVPIVHRQPLWQAKKKRSSESNGGGGVPPTPNPRKYKGGWAPPPPAYAPAFIQSFPSRPSCNKKPWIDIVPRIRQERYTMQYQTDIECVSCYT